MKTRYLTALTLIVGGVSGACAPVVAPSGADRSVYPGFDSWRYPGDQIMSAWRDTSPYRWVGYYLPSPCHRDESFAGKRSFLSGSGWGTAILYVGQQTFEGETPAEITETTLCTSLFLTAERGEIDGRDAANRAAAEGFEPGSIIFLDIERMDGVPPGMVAYFEAWVQAVVEDGRFRPGAYVHRTNASALYTVAQRSLAGLGIHDSMPFWIAGGSGFTLDSVPEESGYRFAEVWQGVLDTRRTWGGESLVVDENVATTPSPSSPTPR